ncbi:acyl-CoA dehydrogenase domain-containing protein [Motilimonas sp. KMU-193]|uniref:acyl-CoA dehydrogenase domain-containing protein n=1 Tax=Motilimonas sp. KMU-193 TaxID=3388668 RepID=UPI00396B46DB
MTDFIVLFITGSLIFLLILAKASLATCSFLLAASLMLAWQQQWLVWWVNLPCLMLIGAFNLTPLRQRYFSNFGLAWFIRHSQFWVKPTSCLGQGWLERKIMTGQIQWHHLHAQPAPRINAQEQAFLDGPTDQLCRLLMAAPTASQPITKAIWHHLKQHGFLTMNQGTHIGGCGFSFYCINKVIQKVASINVNAAQLLARVNSTGAASFIQHCAPSSQQQLWLEPICTGRRFALLITEANALMKKIDDEWGQIQLEQLSIIGPELPDLLIIAITQSSEESQQQASSSPAYLLIDTQDCPQLSHHYEADQLFISLLDYCFPISSLIPPDVTKQWHCLAQAWLKLNLSAVQAAQMKQALMQTQKAASMAAQSSPPHNIPATQQKEMASDKSINLLLRVTIFNACIDMTCSAIDSGESPILIADLLTNEIDNTRSGFVLPAANPYFDYLFTCHPYLRHAYLASQGEPDLNQFDHYFVSHIGYNLNQMTTVLCNKLFSRYHFQAADGFYFRLLKRYSHILAILGEDLLLSSPSLHSRDRQQQRLLRLLSLTYVMAALLRNHQSRAIKFSALNRVVNEIETHLQNIAANMKTSWQGKLFCACVMPSRPIYLADSDSDAHQISKAINEQKHHFQDIYTQST